MLKEITGLEVDTMEAMLKEVKIKTNISVIGDRGGNIAVCNVKIQHVKTARQVLESLCYKVLKVYKPNKPKQPYQLLIY